MVLQALSRPLTPKGLVFNSNETPFAQELLELMNKLKPRIPTPPLTPISPTKLNAILRERVDIFGKHDQQVHKACEVPLTTLRRRGGGCARASPNVLAC